MAKDQAPERPPGMIVSSITVVDVPQAPDRPLRARLAGISAPRRARILVALAAVLAAPAAIIAASVVGGATAGSAGPRAPALTPSQRAAIAKGLGYPYPPRCLTIAVSAGAPDYATAEINTSYGCAPYRGYISATLHRIGGAWRLVLDEGQLYLTHRLPASGLPAVRSGTLGCLSAATLLDDPSFASMGSDRGVCTRP